MNIQNSEEGLIKSWPAEYSLCGGLVSMKSGGELRPICMSKVGSVEVFT